ncbi:MAG: chemotaxis protein CheA, partial [Campylobacterales bacterium]|nr:chemotaxis protein CheA [Campylobacterales bacterium]
MDINKLRDIFIEEANEIIEKLDVDIINFEEDPSDKELLNELFRGVHTLKGSANSFGFSRLGEFVHHFEDVLDFYRSSDESITSDAIDTFLQAVDVIKEVMFVEVDDIQDLPNGYHTCLDAIKSLLIPTQGIVEKIPEEEVLSTTDLGEEFEEFAPLATPQEPAPTADVAALACKLLEEEFLYNITLTIDSDIYFRGFDHIKFLNLLSKEGTLLESYWDMKNVPSLEAFNPECAYIGSISLYLASKQPQEAIQEVFEYLEEHEYTVSCVAKSDKAPPKPVATEEVHYGRRQEDEVVTPAGQPLARRKNDAQSFVKIDTLKLDELFDSIGELVIAQNFLAENEAIMAMKNESITKTIGVLSKITKLIQNRVMSLRMVPIQETFEKMKRVARDASKKVNKEISLVIEGGDTEIDKTMIDALSDPLIHLMRNAIDHGIEDDAAARAAKRKSAIGTVTLRAYHRGGNIAIEITDDGRGINKERVLAKAIERGVIAPEEELSDAQIFGLIMQAGFSTAAQISDISGRGVGLDVVRSSIEKLNGKVEIASKENEGSTFTILLPLTLAIIDGMLVRSEKDTYILPTLSVIESFIPKKE